MLKVEEIFPGDDDNSDFELDQDVLKALADEENVTSQRTIKDELRSKIQSRRVSAGQGELKVEFEPPKEYELTPEERRKIETRKLRNRKSADLSRLKRKRHLEQLIEDEKELSGKNQKLKADVDALQKVKQRMETAWIKHLSICRNKTLKTMSAAQENNATSASECTRVVEETVTSPETSAVQAWDKGNGNHSGSPGNNRGYPGMNGGYPGNNRGYPGNNGINPENNRGNHAMNIFNINLARLHDISKEQKIAMLTAYLKGNNSKPEVQKMIGKINEMTSCSNRTQMVNT